MNLKLIHVTMIGLLASSFASFAQNNPPAAADAAAATPAATAPAAENTNTPPAGIVAPATSQPGAILPLIVMDEVSLREAIRNRAPAAGLRMASRRDTSSMTMSGRIAPGCEVAGARIPAGIEEDNLYTHSQSFIS